MLNERFTEEQFLKWTGVAQGEVLPQNSLRCPIACFMRAIGVPDPGAGLTYLWSYDHCHRHDYPKWARKVATRVDSGLGL